MIRWKNVIIDIFMSIVLGLFLQTCKIFIKYKTKRRKHKTHFKLGLDVQVPLGINVGYFNFSSNL